jgi:hypothetical protein
VLPLRLLLTIIPAPASARSHVVARVAGIE